MKRKKYIKKMMAWGLTRNQATALRDAKHMDYDAASTKLKELADGFRLTTC